MDGGLKDLAVPREDLSGIPRVPEVIVPATQPL